MHPLCELWNTFNNLTLIITCYQVYLSSLYKKQKKHSSDSTNQSNIQTLGSTFLFIFCVKEIQSPTISGISPLCIKIINLFLWSHEVEVSKLVSFTLQCSFCAHCVYPVSVRTLHMDGYWLVSMKSINVQLIWGQSQASSVLLFGETALRSVWGQRKTSSLVGLKEIGWSRQNPHWSERIHLTGPGNGIQHSEKIKGSSEVLPTVFWKTFHGCIAA